MSNINLYDEVYLTERYQCGRRYKTPHYIGAGASGTVVGIDRETFLIEFPTIAGRKKSVWIPKRIVKLSKHKIMKNYISIGRHKIPLSEETAKSIEDSLMYKDELTSFKDCWEKVIGNEKKSYYIDACGKIDKLYLKSADFDQTLNHLPRRSLARKVQLYIQLLVVAEALNDGWKRNLKHTSGSYITYDHQLGLRVWNTSAQNHMTIYFKDTETAKKAIDICPELWEEYFRIQ